MGQIVYKKTILVELKKKGYNITRLERERLLSARSLQSLRTGKAVAFRSLAKICEMLECDVGDIITYDDHADLDTVSDYRR